MKKTGKSKFLKIVKVQYVSDYILQIFFNDKKQVLVDFEPFLAGASNPEIKKYLTLSKFKKFKIKDGELMWGDFDLVFPLNDLYTNTLSKNSQMNSSDSKKIAI